MFLKVSFPGLPFFGLYCVEVEEQRKTVKAWEHSSCERHEVDFGGISNTGVV